MPAAFSCLDGVSGIRGGVGAETETMRQSPTSGRVLAGQVAIVTGASRRVGIGAAICRALAVGGADVLFTHWGAYDGAMPWGRDDGGPSGLAAELRGLGVRAEGVEADLARPETAEAVLTAARERLGVPSILVNNAASSTSDGYERLDSATLDAHYAVNLRGTALLSVGFARGYEGGPGGRIMLLTTR